MKTDTWIERVIIQRLSHPDKRYKYDYQSKEASTVELVVDCAHLKNVTEEKNTAQMLEEIFEVQDQIEATVEQAIEHLRNQNFLTKTGEQPLHKKSVLTKLIEGPSSETEPADTSPIWTLTEEGLAEAARINDAYAEDLARLAAQYESPEDVPHDELFPLLKRYGVIPDAVPRD